MIYNSTNLTNSICDKYTLDSSTKIIHHPGNINTMIHGVNPYQNTENVSIFFSQKSRKSSSNFVTDILNQYITLCHSLLEINSTIYLVQVSLCDKLVFLCNVNYCDKKSRLEVFAFSSFSSTRTPISKKCGCNT